MVFKEVTYGKESHNFCPYFGSHEVLNVKSDRSPSAGESEVLA